MLRKRFIMVKNASDWSEMYQKRTKTTQLSKRISQRKADMGRKYPGQRISKARVLWRDWVGLTDNRRVTIIFGTDTTVASFEAVANVFTEDVVSTTGNTYTEL